MARHAWAVGPVLNEPGTRQPPFGPDCPDLYWADCEAPNAETCREVLVDHRLRILNRGRGQLTRTFHGRPWEE